MSETRTYDPQRDGEGTLRRALDEAITRIERKFRMNDARRKGDTTDPIDEIHRWAATAANLSTALVNMRKLPSGSCGGLP